MRTVRRTVFRRGNLAKSVYDLQVLDVNFHHVGFNFYMLVERQKVLILQPSYKTTP